MWDTCGIRWKESGSECVTDNIRTDMGSPRVMIKQVNNLWRVYGCYGNTYTIDISFVSMPGRPQKFEGMHESGQGFKYLSDAKKAVESKFGHLVEGLRSNLVNTLI